MIENPPLARSLYRAVEPGQSIPFELYAAVAGILAFLYRQKVEERVREQRRRDGAGAGAAAAKANAGGNADPLGNDKQRAKATATATTEADPYGIANKG